MGGRPIYMQRDRQALSMAYITKPHAHALQSNEIQEQSAAAREVAMPDMVQAFQFKPKQ